MGCAELVRSLKKLSQSGRFNCMNEAKTRHLRGISTDRCCIVSVLRRGARLGAGKRGAGSGRGGELRTGRLRTLARCGGGGGDSGGVRRNHEFALSPTRVSSPHLASLRTCCLSLFGRVVKCCAESGLNGASSSRSNSNRSERVSQTRRRAVSRLFGSFFSARVVLSDICE